MNSTRAPLVVEEIFQLNLRFLWKYREITEKPGQNDVFFEFGPYFSQIPKNRAEIDIFHYVSQQKLVNPVNLQFFPL